MILISVFDLNDNKSALLAAKKSGCSLYKVSKGIHQFESPMTNITAVRRLIHSFRKYGYIVTSELLFSK